MDKQHADIVLAAAAWWRNKRPLDFTEADHLEIPTVNTTTGAEARLARAVAALRKSTPTGTRKARGG